MLEPPRPGACQILAGVDILVRKSGVRTTKYQEYDDAVRRRTER